MTRATLAAAVVLASALALAAHHLARDRSTVVPARVGAPLAALSVVSSSGDATLLDMRSGTVVYNVFATWCPECRGEIAQLVRVIPRLRTRGVRVVGIDQGESASAVRALVAQMQIDYPIYFDPDARTIVALGARVIPTTVIVRDGIVRRVIAGPLEAPDILALAREAGE